MNTENLIHTLVVPPITFERFEVFQNHIATNKKGGYRLLYYPTFDVALGTANNFAFSSSMSALILLSTTFA